MTRSETGVDRLFFQAAWENERAVNLCRTVYLLLMAVPAVGYWVSQGAPVPWSTLAMFGYGLVGLAMIPVLKRTYHPALSALIATADATYFVGGMYLLALELQESGHHDHVAGVVTGMTMNALLVIVINLLRFSSGLAIWSTIYGAALATVLGVRLTGWQPGYGFQLLGFAAFAALVVVTSVRFRHVLLRAKERDALARFLPGPAVDRVARDPTVLALGGEEQDATVLFTDIRGFTRLSARSSVSPCCCRPRQPSDSVTPISSRWATPRCAERTAPSRCTRSRG